MVYDISNDQITGSAFLWARSGWIGRSLASPRSMAAGTSDMVLRNVNTGAFQVYNIANNQLTGAASLGRGRLGLAARRLCRRSPPIGASMGSSDASTAQLVQAMAGFGGGSGAADSIETAPLGADTSQQTFLTTPQHA